MKQSCITKTICFEEVADIISRHSTNVESFAKVEVTMRFEEISNGTENITLYTVIVKEL